MVLQGMSPPDMAVSLPRTHGPAIIAQVNAEYPPRVLGNLQSLRTPGSQILEIRPNDHRSSGSAVTRTALSTLTANRLGKYVRGHNLAVFKFLYEHLRKLLSFFENLRLI